VQKKPFYRVDLIFANLRRRSNRESCWKMGFTDLPQC